MPLLRLFCDKQKCVHNDNGGCYCPTAPHQVTPDETSGVGQDGNTHTVTNAEELSNCKNFVWKIK